MTAAVIATGEAKRLFVALEILVAAAEAGEDCAALLAFDGLELFVSPLERGDPDLLERCRALRARALELPNVRLYASAASVEFAQAEPSLENLDGVMPTAEFLAEAAGQRLVFV